mmetsp:Transcript_57353/g.181562  ORF Transcript_57353/g.181562 Transcript_57353/m.181562 type:complete len:632 (+) Transcript_57353:346-2241(+)
MHHVVGEHHVHDGVHVGVHAEVLVVVAGEGHLEAVVVVHHGGDAIEAVAVELVLIEPVAGVGEEVAHCLPVPVVEEARVPHPVVPAGARVEEVVGAVEVVDAIDGVVGGVRVDDVHKHHEPEAMGLIDERLEVLGGAAAGGHAEEVGDVVPEGAVVGVLLHRHDLERVVPKVADAREDLGAELVVGVHLGVDGGHAHVALIDAERARLLRARVLEGVRVPLLEDTGGGVLALRGVPNVAVEGDLTLGLSGPADVGGDAIVPLAVAVLNARLDVGLVGDLGGAVGQVLEEHGPGAGLVLSGPVLLARLPVVEVAHQSHRARRRGVLLVEEAGAAVGEGHAVDAVLLVGLGELVHAARVVDVILHGVVDAPAVLEVAGVAPEGVVPLEALSAIMGGALRHGAVFLHELLVGGSVEDRGPVGAGDLHVVGELREAQAVGTTDVPDGRVREDGLLAHRSGGVGRHGHAGRNGRRVVGRGRGGGGRSGDGRGGGGGLGLGLERLHGLGRSVNGLAEELVLAAEDLEGGEALIGLGTDHHGLAVSLLHRDGAAPGGGRDGAHPLELGDGRGARVGRGNPPEGARLHRLASESGHGGELFPDTIRSHLRERSRPDYSRGGVRVYSACGECDRGSEQNP